jgi:hypothetical protein
MKQSLLYFIAAGLFFIAVGLNLFNEGLNIKTGIGLVLGGGMIVLGLNMRKAGQ